MLTLVVTISSAGLFVTNGMVRSSDEMSVGLNRQTEKIVLPYRTAELVANRAIEAWGPSATVVQSAKQTNVSVWPSRRGRVGPGAVRLGWFSIIWGTPSVDQASITYLEWDPEYGGSEDELRRQINQLAGWPVAHNSNRMTTQTAPSTPPNQRTS